MIDEYDKPILDHVIADKETARRNRDKLKGFYGIMKDLDESTTTLKKRGLFPTYKAVLSKTQRALLK